MNHDKLPFAMAGNQAGLYCKKDEGRSLSQSKLSGDSAAMESALGQALPILYRVAQRLTHNETEAEDLVGQTLAKAIQGWSGFDGRFPKSWLIRILRNEFLEGVRKSKSRPNVVEISEAAFESIPEGSLDVSHLEATEVMDAIEKLPEEYRTTIILFDVEQLTYEEIASAMSLPLGTVRSRLFRGRRLLRRALPTFGETL